MQQNRSEHKLVLYRILGNDLFPRHKKGQTYNNLKFMLQHEPTFKNCQKKWVVNRIFDFKMEQKIIKLLEKCKSDYIHIPFDVHEYYNSIRKSIEDKRAAEKLKSLEQRERYNKILYVMNNNGARNVALRDGKQIADWVLPFDGNCCFTDEGWRQMVDILSLQTTFDKYFVVPMYRLTNNRQYFNFFPNGYAEHEPQMIFGKYTDLEFNESVRYGRGSKIELLGRLKLSGINNYNYAYIVNDPACRCGYVVRLFSGVKRGEVNWPERVRLRERGIDRLLQRIDKICRKNLWQ